MTKIYTISFKGTVEVEANSQDDALDRFSNRLIDSEADLNVTYMNIENESDSF